MTDEEIPKEKQKKLLEDWIEHHPTAMEYLVDAKQKLENNIKKLKFGKSKRDDTE